MPANKKSAPLSKQQMLLLIAGATLILFFVILIVLIQAQTGGKAPSGAGVAVLPASEKLALTVGGEASASVNLSTIWIEKQGENTSVQLGLVQVDENGEDIAATGMPRYEVYLHTQPARLEVVLPTMTSWDYNAKLQLAGQTLVEGVFQHVNEQDAGGHIYFQLSQEVTMAVKERGQTLVLTLTPKPNESAMCWRVAVNALDSIVETPLVRDLIDRGMTPSLCDDLASTTMLSQPFATEREAKAFADELRQMLSSWLPGEVPLVLNLQSDALPPLMNSADPAAFAPAAVFKPEGKAFTAELLLHNARLLAAAPRSGDMLLLRTARTRAGDQSGTAEEQQLLRMDDQGRRFPLLEAELPTVDDAVISPDGQWAALCESTQGGRALYLYRFDSGDLIPLQDQIGQAGIGYAFATGDKLYVMAENGFYCVDPSRPLEDENAVTLVDHQPPLDGKLEARDLLLYASDGYAQILRINPITGTREAFAEGGTFQLSPDGAWMLAQTYANADSQPKLTLIRLADGTLTEIGATAETTDFCWANDSSAVYYTTNADSQDAYTIYRYTLADSQIKQLGSMNASSLAMGAQAGELLVSTMVRDGDRPLWAVYRLRVAP